MRPTNRNGRRSGAQEKLQRAYDAPPQIKGFFIGDRFFSRKGDAEKEVKNILASYDIGSPLVGADLDLVLALLERHSERDAKVAKGVAGIAPKWNNANGFRTKGFHVLHPDGSSTAWSYLHCFNPTSQMSPAAAMRYAVVQSQKAARAAWVFDLGEVCGACGCSLTDGDNGEMHHEAPWSFKALAACFTQSFGQPAMRYEPLVGPVMADETQAAQWVAFHDKRAKRSLLCTPCHKSTTREAAPSVLDLL